MSEWRRTGIFRDIAAMELFGDFVSARDKAPMDTGEDELFMDEETIAYGQAFALYQIQDGAWQKVTPERLVDSSTAFPAEWITSSPMT